VTDVDERPTDKECDLNGTFKLCKDVRFDCRTIERTSGWKMDGAGGLELICGDGTCRYEDALEQPSGF